jgi:hypothetical protein
VLFFACFFSVSPLFYLVSFYQKLEERRKRRTVKVRLKRKLHPHMEKKKYPNLMLILGRAEPEILKK